jgi:hypothetical protein
MANAIRQIGACDHIRTHLQVSERLACAADGSARSRGREGMPNPHRQYSYRPLLADIIKRQLRLDVSEHWNEGGCA